MHELFNESEEPERMPMSNRDPSAFSQAAKRIEVRLKREKEMRTAYSKTLKILGENKE
jgi:hypothetical protein